jgi:hypothetical protein
MVGNSLQDTENSLLGFGRRSRRTFGIQHHFGENAPSLPGVGAANVT